ANGVDLLFRAVFVLLALHHENGRADAGQRVLDVPLAELRIEPRAVPAPESRVHVLVPAGEALAQPAAQVRVARRLDAVQAGLLGEDVWRLEDQRARRSLVENGDRSAVAVAHEDGII